MKSSRKYAAMGGRRMSFYWIQMVFGSVTSLGREGCRGEDNWRLDQMAFE